MPTTATWPTPHTNACGSLRPFERGDVPAVAQQFNRSFRRTTDPPSAKLGAFFENLFFDAPCQKNTSLRCYVYEDESGDIRGFVGTHPRSFVLDGKPVTAAAYGQLMVAPELRGRGIAYELVKRFYEGGQEYTFCGSAAPATRAINKRLGGINPDAYGLTWRKTLRPMRSLVRRMAHARKLGPLRHLASAWTSDLNLQTFSDPNGSLDLCAVETVHERAYVGMRFHPLFEPDHLCWKLRLAAASSKRATFASVVDTDDGPIGWYVWYLEASGSATVVEFLCVPGHHKTVLERMIAEARDAGAESIGGLCRGTAETDELRSLGATLHRAESTFVFHARDPQLLQTFPDGPQHLSVFDGEGWIDFPH